MCRRDVQRSEIFVSPGEIRRLFGKDNGAQVMACRVPDPDALGARHVDVARFIEPHAVGNSARLLFLREYTSVPEKFAVVIPDRFSDVEAAPLLCAGIVGYRSLRLSDVEHGERLGLFGYGGSALGKEILSRRLGRKKPFDFCAKLPVSLAGAIQIFPALCRIGSNVTFYPNCFIQGSPGRFIIEDHVEFFPGTYISLGDATADGAIAVRIYHKPLVLLIWFGPILMAFGGVLSLSDRRLRVGAPKPAKAMRGLQAAE